MRNDRENYRRLTAWRWARNLDADRPTSIPRRGTFRTGDVAHVPAVPVGGCVGGIRSATWCKGVPDRVLHLEGVVVAMVS